MIAFAAAEFQPKSALRAESSRPTSIALRHRRAVLGGGCLSRRARRQAAAADEGALPRPADQRQQARTGKADGREHQEAARETAGELLQPAQQVRQEEAADPA